MNMDFSPTFMNIDWNTNLGTCMYFVLNLQLGFTLEFSYSTAI